MEQSEQGRLICEQYKQNMGIYENFCVYLKSQMEEILRKAEIYYYELSFRVKTLDSVLEKIDRKSLLVNSIQDIQDMIGFRIITLFKQDAAIVCETVRNAFQVIWEEDKSEGKEDDTFGYLSVHFQIKPPQDWLRSPTTSRFEELEAELQVRTFSQHIWAASSHLLQYKKESTVPYVMRRNINRLAAVLEIVDDELESILMVKEEYQLSLQKTSCQEGTRANQALDSVFLEHILDEFFLGENKKTKEPFDDLLEELNYCGVRTVGQLEDLLSSESEKIQKMEAGKRSVHGEPFFSYAGRLRIAMQSHFPKVYAKMRNNQKYIKGE